MFLLLHFKNSLYILANSPLFGIFFAHIFSQSLACLIILFDYAFYKRIKLVLMKPSLSVISFIDHALALNQRSHCQAQDHPDFLEL